jgi:haloacetate dehalogenase
MAAELIQLMASLGHERFAVVGHDRGTRVGYRLAFDHRGVTRAALLNVLPTLDQFERMGGSWEAPARSMHITLARGGAPAPLDGHELRRSRAGVGLVSAFGRA